MRLGQDSLEAGLYPPQCVLDSPSLSLAGLLDIGITVAGQEMDVRGGETGDAAPEVGLQVLVRAVGIYCLLEGVDLTHNFCYAPRTKYEWADESTCKKDRAQKLKLKILKEYTSRCVI